MYGHDFNEICDEFEAAWSNEERPEIENFLERAPSEDRAALLYDLVQVELRLRRDESPSPSLDQYRERFSEYRDIVEESYHAFHKAMHGEQEQATLPPSSETENRPCDLEITLAASTGGANYAENATIAPDQTQVKEETSRAGDRVRYFGEYELLEEIARGGMGVVYKARQVKLNRIVALKMILAGQLAGEEEVQRFHAEAEAAANLDHPGVVPIYEFGEHQGQHYFSMGYIEGESLADKIKDGPMAPKDAAETIAKVAEAIAYAHESGVIHRDLKPANVLIDSGNQPKVTDFGLAKRVESDSDLTRTGAVMGTPSYMPPEQASGKTDEIAEPADVYSLGAILYCLITGRPPFQASNALDTLMQVLETEPVSPRSLNPEIPKDLETVCLKCLQKDPSRRYQSAGELSVELGRFLSGEPVIARPVGVAERVLRWGRRKPALAASVALCLALLVVLGTGGPIIAWQKATLAEQQSHFADQQSALLAAAEKERRRAEENEEKESKAKQLALRQLYRARIALAQNAWQDNLLNRVNQVLDSCIPSGNDPDLRGWEWHHLKSISSRGIFNLKKHEGTIHGVDWSPDGDRLATVKGRSVTVWDLSGKAPPTRLPEPSITDNTVGGAVYWCDSGRIGFARIGSHTERAIFTLWDLEEGRELCSFEMGAVFGETLAVCPRTMKVAVATATYERKEFTTIWETANAVKIWHAETGDLLSNIECNAIALAWDPTGQWLAMYSDKGFQVIDPLTGQERLNLPGAFAERIAWSPRGDLLFTAGPNEERYANTTVWDVSSGEELIKIPTGGVWSMTCSPDGSQLATSGRNQLVRVWNLKDGSFVREFKENKGLPTSLVWSPDGRRLATCSWGGELSVREAWRDQQDIALPFSRDDSGSSDTITFAWSHDSTRIAWATVHQGHWKLRVSRVSDGRELAMFEKPYPAPGQLAWNPDGEILAATSGKQIILFDPEKGNVIQIISGHRSGSVHNLAWSPDGRRLATTSIASISSGSRSDADNLVRIWDANSGQQVTSLPSPGIASRICWLSNQTLWHSQGNSSSLWNVDESKQISSVDFSFPPEPFCCSPNGESIVLLDTATGDEFPQIQTRDLTSGEIICSTESRIGNIKSISWNPNGHRICLATEDGEIQILEAHSLQEVYRISDAGGLTAWSPDGIKLASLTSKGEIRIWDAPRDND